MYSVRVHGGPDFAGDLTSIIISWKVIFASHHNNRPMKPRLRGIGLATCFVVVRMLSMKKFERRRVDDNINDGA